MKKLLTAILIIFCANATFAQQDAMITQYMFNGLYINPAYAGTHKYFQSTLQHRRQWTNFEGAPKTSVLAIDGPINFEKMGVGLVIADDKIGVTHQTDFSGIYSYHLKMGKGNLSMGVKGGVSRFSSDVTDLRVWDPSENIYMNDIKNRLIPKFGFGAYYYQEKFYAGFSIPTLLAYDSERDFKLDLEKSSFYRKHYFLTSGGIIRLNDLLTLRPSFLVKYVPEAPMQGDLNLSIMIKEMLWIGATYRTNDAIVGIVECQITPNLRLGYSFDYTTSTLRKYSSGSHEIMIGYDFLKKDAIKTKTPRFF